jgi:hypothetical protein
MNFNDKRRENMRYILIFAVLALAGCGETSNREGSQAPTGSAGRVGPDSCIISCHAGTRDQAGIIAEEWKASRHKAFGVDCEKCHGDAGAHVGFGPILHPNPDEDGICITCHLPDGLSKPHYASKPGSALIFMTDTNKGKCRNCHNPHDPTGSIGRNREWSASGHGKLTAAAFTADDFKTKPGCVRCHTTTGFINYLNTGSDAAWGSPSDPAREVILCYACHIGYGARQRATDAVTVHYRNTPAYTFPDFKESNICVYCHVAQDSGDAITNTGGDFSKTPFIVSHNLSNSGGTYYAVGGYSFPGMDYTNQFLQHQHVGLNNFEQTGFNGPCIGCHLTPNHNHGFDPFIRDYAGTVTGVSQGACFSCHGTVDDIMANQVNWSKPYYEASLEALRAELADKGFFYTPTAPYFLQTNWLTGIDTDTSGWTTGKRNMGAAFNYAFLKQNPGAYVHNPNYAKRLIYDSIDWLDDNQLNGSAWNTLSNSAVHMGKPWQVGAQNWVGSRP